MSIPVGGPLRFQICVQGVFVVGSGPGGFDLDLQGLSLLEVCVDVHLLAWFPWVITTGRVVVMG